VDRALDFQRSADQYRFLVEDLAASIALTHFREVGQSDDPSSDGTTKADSCSCQRTRKKQYTKKTRMKLKLSITVLLLLALAVSSQASERPRSERPDTYFTIEPGLSSQAQVRSRKMAVRCERWRQ